MNHPCQFSLNFSSINWWLQFYCCFTVSLGYKAFVYVLKLLMCSSIQSQGDKNQLP